MAYLSRSSRTAAARTLTIGLVSEAWARPSMMGASVPGRASAERLARVTRPGSAERRAARARWWLPWS